MNRNAHFPAPTLISLGDVDLEIFEAGRENRGKPIVLCHGWPEHAYSWRHQMAALAAAGYHVIVPNQRGYGNSARPPEVTDYDIAKLTGDLAGLLDHFGYQNAVFAGHDWGANVVWIEFMESVFGPDNYFVHFNRQPGVADAVLDANTGRFLCNLFRKNVHPALPKPGMMTINVATASAPLGDPVMSDEDLSVFISSFQATGFTESINWYRNMDRNWHILADVDPVIRQPALMIYGTRDMIPPSETLADFVPNVEVLNLDCGHWIQQEKPEETTQAMRAWLADRQAA